MPDTKAKRLRVMNLGRIALTLPDPAASIDSDDRHHLLGLYPPESTGAAATDIHSKIAVGLNRIGIS